MSKQQHNINTIAEILIQELQTIEKSTKKLDLTAQTIEDSVSKISSLELKIDANSMGKFLSSLKSNIDGQIFDLEQKIKKQNRAYFPIYLAIGFFVFGLFGGIGMYYGIAQKVENRQLKKENTSLNHYVDFAKENPKTFDRFLKKHKLSVVE